MWSVYVREITDPKLKCVANDSCRRDDHGMGVFRMGNELHLDQHGSRCEWLLDQRSFVEQFAFCLPRQFDR